MEKELKNESKKLKNKSKELNVYIKKNIKDERCDLNFYGANLKFSFGRKNYDRSKEFLGKLTENLSLFFIIFTTNWCCLTEYDIILPLILNKETTYEEVMDKYINSVEIDDNAIKRIEEWNNFNHDEKIDHNDIKLGLNNLRAFIYIIYNKYKNKESDDCHIIRINMENALELNSNPGPYSIEGSIDYETLIDEYSLSSKKE